MRIHPITIGLLAASLVGCGRGGPRTYPVKGVVQLTSGDVKLLAGSHVEVALIDDPTVRASGEIREDGSFKLQTRHNGDTISGVRPGTYQARIILADDDQANLRRAASALALRFRDFKTSGLSLTVPATEAIVLTISDR